MAVSFFDIKRQNDALKKELAAAVSAVVASGRFILGDNVSSFEKEIADYCGAKFGVGVASGTDALHLALRACGVKPGDEVITSPFTFVATAEAIAYCGAKPVFCDIDAKSFNLDPAKIEEKITSKTKAILPVHIYGQACEMDKIMAIAKKHNLAVMEDAAQAIGAEICGKKVCSFGDAAGTSFFPTKNLGCFGDGGMVITNKEKLADELKVLRGHGSRKTYHYDIIGYNSRLDALQAAILRVKLPHLDDFSRARRKNAALYNKLLKDVDQLTLPVELKAGMHVYNQYTIRVKDRDGLFGYLKVKNIGAMVYYPLCLHLQKAFAFLGHKPGDFKESEAAQNEVISLPIYPELNSSEIEEVSSAIKEFYKK
ncbi:MAG: DegT/DnrJ/EryC1/StrS family aminotransferase [Candidatus Saganbacteria bacterium]|nr:DegT/DnrJ/EryC1/StrS family aminotransferase [Candidatus Saganbacteria bacterium]